MTETRKFPAGKDVIIVRKQDILDCIDSNILDKEVALAVIEQCEKDCIEYLNQGVWAGIPYIGNIRPAQAYIDLNNPEQKEILDAAKDTLSTKDYYMFRGEMAKQNQKRINANKYYKYCLSMAVNKNKKAFIKRCNLYGESITRLRFFFCRKITTVGDWEDNG